MTRKRKRKSEDVRRTTYVVPLSIMYSADYILCIKKSDGKMLKAPMKRCFFMLQYVAVCRII